MNTIIEFYKGLDPLNTIIFWGIIIVILLLLVFSILMINKHKKNKKDSNKNDKDELFSDEIALPSNSRDTLIMKDENLLIQNEQKEKFEPFVIPQTEAHNETIEVEKNFKAEEHVMEYDNELFNLSNVKKNSEIIPDVSQSLNEKPVFTMPTKPYERNVLREMSLNQTSPIGIVKPSDHLNKPVEKINANPHTTQVNIEHSLNNPEKNVSDSSLENKKTSTTANEASKVQPQEAKIVTNNISKVSVKSNNISNLDPSSKGNNNESHLNYQKDVSLTNQISKNVLHSELEINNIALSSPPVSTNSSKPQQTNNIESKQDNARFLEEVSKKLAEADIPDEIDRTDYELQQEEDAIISYKELMEKKDTIKTIDEEDAIISIKELTQRKNTEEKLYNLTENEANNEFLDELKKFRNDLQ